MERTDRLEFCTENGEKVFFYVVEQTRINGIDYLLVTDEESGDGQALILRDMSQNEEAESLYEIVEDDAELDAVGGVFANMLEDIDITR